VAGLDLLVPAGSFYGIVGPNGAGKSTTLKMVTGLLRPDEGRVVIDGVDMWADPVEAKRRIGVLPEDLLLFERLTGQEVLAYAGLLRSMDPAVIDRRADELLGFLGLVEARGVVVSDYSQGMRKKLALAAAMIHGPRVLFLDEPFESVDPVSSRTIRQLLSRFTASGATVVFSSHVMETVENLCDHVAVMHLGRLVDSGTITEVRRGKRLEEAFVELVGAATTGEEGLDWLAPARRAAASGPRRRRPLRAEP
jgi:ABC-2 type transport system ATP-binding protein